MKTDESIDHEYLMDTYKALEIAPIPSQKKIIFIFFSPEKAAYINWLRTHNRRTATADAYEAQLNAMAPTVLSTLGWFAFDEIGEEEIYALMDAFTGICARTRKTYIETFGRFVYFVTGVNPVIRSQILWDDCEPTHCVFIDEEDWPKIKSSARNSTDRLILGLGAYLALRREEMVRLKVTDIDWPNITIHGKGHGRDGKVAVRTMPEPLRVLLKVYLADRARVNPDTDQLFVRIDGKQKGKVMTGSSIRYACDQMVKRCGIKFTPHSLRRLHATTIWETSGHDLSVSMQSTRHISADVFLNCYIKRDPKKVEEAVDKLCGRL